MRSLSSGDEAQGGLPGVVGPQGSDQVSLVALPEGRFDD